MPSFPHTLRLLTAGILALPALLLLVIISPCIVILSLPSLLILVRRKYWFRHFSSSLSSSSSLASNDNSDNNKEQNNNDSHHSPLLQHAIITGGSSGIGLAIACELARRQCRNITLMARKEGQLKEAKVLVEKAANNGGNVNVVTTVNIISVDVTDFNALEKVAAKLCSNNNNHDATKSIETNETTTTATTTTIPAAGPPTLLFNCAGYANPLSFVDLSSTDFQSQMNVNYLGSVHVVKAFLPYMMMMMEMTGGNNNNNNNNYGGNIILTSSMSGQVGSYGYSAYSPTKFALRGFAECLSMELAAMGAANTTNTGGGKRGGGRGCQINVSLAYPPDTNTPGYEVENLKKPEACRLISESGGIWDPKVVGKKIVNQALSPNPPFDIYFGIDGWMLSTLTAGMNPVTSVLDAICQVSLMGLLRFVSLFYLMDFGRLTQNCYACREGEEDKKVVVGGGNSGIAKEEDSKKEGSKND